MLVVREGARVTPGSHQAVVVRQQVVDIARHPDLGVDEDDHVVADPLEIRDDVRGEQDAELVLDHGLHEDLKELPARQGVQARDRLVEDQQLRPLGEPQRQRELGLLAAGELAGALAERQAEPLDAAVRDLVVPLLIQAGSETQVLRDRQVRVRRGVLRDVAHLGQLGRSLSGTATADFDAAGGGRGHPDRELQQRRLACTVGPVTSVVPDGALGVSIGDFTPAAADGRV